MKRQSKQCPYCPRQISLSNFISHTIACHPKPPSKSRSEIQLSIAPEIRKQRASKAQMQRHDNFKRNREKRICKEGFDNLYQSEKRERILREQHHRCSECSIGLMWNDKPLKFELDHIDGNRSNECRSNLRLICPNCHQQTPTYKGKNASGRTYTDTQIASALRRSKSIYNTIRLLEMNVHGTHYERVRRVAWQIKDELSFTV
jgi:hypothetical protein